ncbi:hypothetical protein C8R45DRAFT_628966 [Mycena sanguinolenta]|nr:hypothetical protein C8R45DRAFT_628966 [Mycena sanguinolenta]
MHINFAHYDWALILRKLTMGELKELRVLRCKTLAMPDLVQFLARHVQITILDLGGCEMLGALTPPISARYSASTFTEPTVAAASPAEEGTTPTPETFLPHLTSLTASPEWLLYFLGPPDFSAPTYSPTTTFFSKFSLWSGPFVSTATTNGRQWYPTLRNITAYSVKSWSAKAGDDPSGPYHAAQLARARACAAARGLNLQVGWVADSGCMVGPFVHSLHRRYARTHGQSRSRCVIFSLILLFTMDEILVSILLPTDLSIS